MEDMKSRASNRSRILIQKIGIRARLKIQIYLNTLTRQVRRITSQVSGHEFLNSDLVDILNGSDLLFDDSSIYGDENDKAQMSGIHNEEANRESNIQMNTAATSSFDLASVTMNATESSLLFDSPQLKPQ